MTSTLPTTSRVETPPSVAELSAAQHRLQGLRRKVRAAFLFNGLWRVLLTALALLAIGCALDFALRLPQEVRWINAAACGLVVALVAWRTLGYPLTRRLGRRDMALQVEREYPALQDRLISALQFAETYDDYQGRQSAELTDATIRAAAQAARDLDMGAVVKHMRRRLLQSAAVLALVALVPWGMAQADPVRLLVERFFGSGEAFPVETELSVHFDGETARVLPVSAPAWDPRRVLNFAVDRQTHVVTAARESDLTVLAHVVRGKPTRADLISEMSGRSREARMESLDRGSDTRFRAAFPSLLSDFGFHILADDGRSESWTVRVVAPPRLESMRVSYHYPPYLKRPDETLPKRNIRAPMGTRAAIELTTNKPIRGGWARLRTASDEADRVLRPVDDDGLPLPPDRPARRFRTAPGEPLEVRVSESFRILLFDEDGLVNTKEEALSIEAIADQAPVIVESLCSFGELLGGDPVYWATPEAAAPFVLAATDDLGLEALRLYVRVGDEANAEHQVAGFTRLFAGSAEDPYPTDGLLENPHRTLVRLRELTDAQGAALIPANAGDSARLDAVFRVEVEDTFEPFHPEGAPAPGGNTTALTGIRYRIVSRERLLSRLYDEIKRLKEESAKLAHSQNRALAAVESASELFAEGAQVNDAAREMLYQARSHQERVGKGCGGPSVGGGFRSVLRLYRGNDLEAGDPHQPTTRRLERILALCESIGGALDAVPAPEERNPSLSERAFERISVALTRQSTAAQAALAMEEALRAQQGCRERFEEIMRLLDEWEHFGEMEQMLRRILQRQESLNDDYRHHFRRD